MSLHALLARGYLPKELPDSFTSSQFAKLLSPNLPSFPGAFGVTISPTVNRFPSVVSGKPYRYSHARGEGFSRRHLSIPNPIHYFLLCREVLQYWNEIAPRICGSDFTATAPVFCQDGRALQGKDHHNHRDWARSTRLNNRFILKTDISRFYHSIYTHSIPWALHSKSVAKARKTSPSLLGNRLDYLVRQGQDGQTIGIPVGPDTSFLLAELLMHRCDEALKKEMPRVKGHRVIDDYELGFRERSQAEDAFHIIENCLREYELALNTKKTRIISLPYPLEPTSISSIRGFTFRDTQWEEATDIQSYFDRAFEFHQREPEAGIISYAVGRISREDRNFNAKNWSLLENFLMLCIAPEPACLPYALTCIINNFNRGTPIDKAALEAVLNTLIIERTKLGHTSEVAWALWGCLALQLQIHSDAVTELNKTEDSVLVLLALHCEKRELTFDSFDQTRWRELMTESSLYDEHWLLAYEANVRGWLHGPNGRDFVAADGNFGFLKANNVSFYDNLRTDGPAANGTAPLPKPPTVSLTRFGTSDT